MASIHLWKNTKERKRKKKKKKKKKKPFSKPEGQGSQREEGGLEGTSGSLH